MGTASKSVQLALTAAAFCTAGANAAKPVPDNPEIAAVYAVVDRQIGAYNRHDEDAFAATYAPDAGIYSSDKGEEPVTRDREAIRVRYTKTFAENIHRRAEVIGRVGTALFATYHEFLPDAPMHTLATYEVHDGLITRVWLHSVAKP